MTSTATPDPENSEKETFTKDVEAADVVIPPATNPSTTNKYEEIEYPKGWAFAMIMAAIWLSLFLVALVSLYPYSF
jgi:hypothetical protein